MKFTKLVTAVALSVTALGSFASTFNGTLDLTTGSNGFFRTPLAGESFVDTYAFSLAGSSYVTTGAVNSSDPGGQDLDFTNVTIMQGLATIATFANTSISDAQESRTLLMTLLAAGNYSLVISGIQSPGAGSYGGQLAISAAPVPEPETYALMLAGLGAMGFVARRRRAN